MFSSQALLSVRLIKSRICYNPAFTIKDLGFAKYFLGFKIARSTKGTSVTQQKYIRDIISDVGLQSSKPTATPLPLGLKLTSHNVTPLTDPEPYRRLVGHLLYLSFTRPDILFGAQQLSQFIHNPRQVHMDASLHLWISYLLRDLRIDVPTPIPVFCDNQAAIHIVANPVFHERTKHLEIDCHLVRDKFKAGFVLPTFVSGRSQLANMFTKSLSHSAFDVFLSKLGMVTFPHVQLERGMKKCRDDASPLTQQ
ncbi:UNVERIFIED_CONTAM: Retrovirus-related Pol polyprotein from transposon RE1 [Sesamum angustifolium]|uniref:Retrovirus-related Pol polyprotein from transposon RE1 n=1 Tax=Sesamum angustifolium TaxID=2727405 RepID=A0AAW2INN0_9LAMI